MVWHLREEEKALQTTALVIGGCGFIGRHVVASLLADGQAVRTLDLGPGLPDKRQRVR